MSSWGVVGAGFDGLGAEVLVAVPGSACGSACGSVNGEAASFAGSLWRPLESAVGTTSGEAVSGELACELSYNKHNATQFFWINSPHNAFNNMFP